MHESKFGASLKIEMSVDLWSDIIAMEATCRAVPPAAPVQAKNVCRWIFHGNYVGP